MQRASPSMMSLASRHPLQCLCVPANRDAKCEPYLQRIGLPSMLLSLLIMCAVRGVADVSNAHAS